MMTLPGPPINIALVNFSQPAPSTYTAPVKPHNAAWEQAFQNCKQRLKREDWDCVSSATSSDALLDSITSLEKQYNSRRSARFLHRCHSIVECLRPFMAAVDVFVQSNPVIASLVWGSIRVVLQVVGPSDRIADCVTKSLEKICLRLPRYKKLLDLFPMAPTLERCLVEMYSRVIDFAVYIINYFRTNPIKNLAKSLFGKFENELVKRSTRISKQASEIDEEERIADHEANKTRFETIQRLLGARPPDFNNVKPVRCIPFSRNTGFFGREKELQGIRDSLAGDGSTTQSQRAVVLHGLGGLGKTEIALAFAYQEMDNYHSILWVAAETPQKLQTSFSEIAAKLNLPSCASRDEVTIRDEVLRWLSATESTWLMILDNAPDETSTFLREYWPNGTNGSILATTRNSRLAREFGVSTNLSLGPLDEDSSLKLLLQGSHGSLASDAEKKAREICNRLGYLPLALSQMGGYIAESGCSLDGFLNTYHDFENLGELHKASIPGSTTGYQHTVSTVWAMNMSLLENKSITALRTLSILAFLDPDGFEVEVFEKASPKVTLPKDFQYLSRSFPLQQSIRPLQNHNLVTLDRDAGIIKIHRVLQDATMMRLTAEQKIDTFEATIQLLHYVFPTRTQAEANFDTIRQAGDRFYPHVLAALKRFEEQKVDVMLSLELYNLIENLFWYLRERGLYHTAMTCFDMAADIYGKDRENNLLNLAFLYGTIGTIYRNSDNAARAVEYFRDEITCIEEAVALGKIEPHHMQIGVAYEHMANATQQLKNYDEASTWHRKNLDLLNRFHPENKMRLAMSYVNQSWALWKTGKLDEASQTLEWVLQTAEAALEVNANDHQALRPRNFSLRVLGNVRLSQGRYGEAFTIHKRAFEGQVLTFGDNHFETGVLCHRMGCHYERMGEIETSIQYFQAALAVFDSTPVEMESHVVRTRYKLGTLLVQHNENEEGTRLLQLARKGREDLNGTPGNVDDAVEHYDSLVPYWAW